MAHLTEAERKLVIDTYGVDGYLRPYSEWIDDYDEIARIIELPYKVN